MAITTELLSIVSYASRRNQVSLQHDDVYVIVLHVVKQLFFE